MTTRGVLLPELSRSAQRVADALSARGLDTEVRELPASTRSARDAATALGCGLPQIVKSLVFRDIERDRPVLVLAAGPDRVDETRLASVVGGAVEQAPAAWVKLRTGFAVGGVPPLGHTESLVTFMDARLLDQDLLWAAAGTPRAVFSATPKDLLAACGAEVAAVTD